MPESICVSLLGPVHVERSGVAVAGFESHKALALVCYLAVRAEAVPRAELADLFWGDRREEQSRANLSRVLHNDAALLPGVLAVSRTTARFVGGDANWRDVAAFDDLAGRGDLAALAAAAHLYRGDFMEGMYLKGCPDFETWLLTEQEVWRQRVADVLSRLVEGHRQAGDYRLALRYAERLLALDPWREEAHRQIMLLLALSGRRAAALAQYRACCEVLDRELGVAPSAQTTALYERLRSGAGPAGGTADGRAAGLGPAGSRKAGRAASLERILDRLANPACRLLTLLGPDSAGLVRLALDVAGSLRAAFQHGVHFLPHAACQPPGTLAAVMAEGLHVARDRDKDLTPVLFDYVREKEMLLIVSNFQPCPEEARLIEGILKRAPGVQFLVTARAPVNICAEWILDVPAGGV